MNLGTFYDKKNNLSESILKLIDESFKEPSCYRILTNFEQKSEEKAHLECCFKLILLTKNLKYLLIGIKEYLLIEDEFLIKKLEKIDLESPYSHLLVYYADPALRQTLASKWVTYPSEKYPGTVWTEWVDLGDVRGAAGGIHIIEDVDDLDDLKDAGTWIPPEQLTDSGGTILDPDAAGWAVTYTPSGSSASTVYCYDYNAKVWYPIGAIDPGLVEPRRVIIKSAPVGDTQMPDPVDVSLLNDYGFWLASEIMYYAN
jgi:hypothetical protein